MRRLYSVLRIPIAMIVGVLILNYSNPIYALTMDDLVKREGLFFEKFTTTPFTGEVDKGLFQGAISNGLREGEWFAFHENGQLHNQGSWKNGRKNGKWVSYHDNGQLKQEGNYKNGVRVGEWRVFHRNSKLRQIGNYKVDADFVCHIEPDSKGLVSYLGTFSCDEGIKTGLWVEYHENGQESYKGEYRGGKQNGIWVSYQENGQVYSQGELIDGVAEGKWEYFIDGKPFLFMSGYYKNGKKVSD